jgi:hypothetical protein
MDLKYEMIIVLIICIIYNRLSLYWWNKVVINDSIINKALSEVNSKVGKFEGGINFLDHNSQYIKQNGKLKDKMLNMYQRSMGGHHVMEGSMNNYIKTLKEKASKSIIDPTKLSPESLLNPIIKSNFNATNLFDYEKFNSPSLSGLDSSGAINISKKLIDQKLEDLQLKELEKVNKLTNNFDVDKKTYTIDEVKKSILSKLPPDMKSEVIEDLKKKQSAGGFFGKVEKKAASEMSPHSPLTLAKYWFLRILPLMIVLGIVGVLIVNSISEFTEDTNEDIGDKLESIVIYVYSNLLVSICLPMFFYCLLRFIFDLLKFDGFIIPVLGEIVEVVERIPFLWGIIFSTLIISIYTKLITFADIGPASCKDKDGKPEYKKRCFPFVWNKECPSESSSFTCWFKI